MRNFQKPLFSRPFRLIPAIGLIGLLAAAASSCNVPFHADLFSLASSKTETQPSQTPATALPAPTPTPASSLSPTGSPTAAPTSTPTVTPTITPTPTATPTPTPTVAAPGINTTQNPCSTAVTVTITESTIGAVIYYTLDGSAPTAASTPATSGIPFNINCGSIAIAPATAVNVQAIAYKGGLPSTVASSSIPAITLSGGPNDPPYNPGILGFDNSQINFDGITGTEWDLYGSTVNITSGSWSGNSSNIYGTFGTSFLSPSGMAQVGIGHGLTVYNGGLPLNCINKSFTFHVKYFSAPYQLNIAINLKDASGKTNHSEYIPIAPGWNTIQLTTDASGAFPMIPLYGNNAYQTAGYDPTNVTDIWFVLAASNSQIGVAAPSFYIDSFSWQ